MCSTPRRPDQAARPDCCGGRRRSRPASPAGSPLRYQKSPCVARVRIERGHHAVDRTLDQLGIVGLFDIVGPDALEYLAKQIELRVSIRSTCGGFGGCDQMPALRAGNEKRQARSGERATEK